MNEDALQQWLVTHDFNSDHIDAIGPCGLTPLMRAA